MFLLYVAVTSNCTKMRTDDKLRTLLNEETISHSTDEETISHSTVILDICKITITIGIVTVSGIRPQLLELGWVSVKEQIDSSVSLDSFNWGGLNHVTHYANRRCQAIGAPDGWPDVHLIQTVARVLHRPRSTVNQVCMTHTCIRHFSPQKYQIFSIYVFLSLFLTLLFNNNIT